MSPWGTIFGIDYLSAKTSSTAQNQNGSTNMTATLLPFLTAV